MSWKRTKCIILSCQATGKHFPGRRFFQFPKENNVVYHAWVEAIGESAVVLKTRKQPYICHIHFDDKCIGKKYLKKGAIPTLLLGNNCSQNIVREEDTSGFDYTKATKTYSRKNMVELMDFTVEELNTCSKSVPCDDKCTENEIICSNCIKYLRANKYYIKKIKIMEQQLKKFKLKKGLVVKKNKFWKNKAIHYKKKYDLLKTNTAFNLNSQIDVLSKPNEHAKVFSKLILNLGSNVYTDAEKWLSQCIYFRSSTGYRFLRDVLGFHLPSIASLHNWIKIKSLSPGPDESVLIEISKAISKLPTEEKDVALIFDEMSVQSNLVYNKYKDRIDGFVDYGDSRTEILAKSVCVFMFRSLI